MRVILTIEDLVGMPKSKLIRLRKKYIKKRQRLSELLFTLKDFKIPTNEITPNAIYEKMQIHQNMASNIFWFIRMKYEYNYDMHHPNTSFFPMEKQEFYRKQYKREQKLKRILNKKQLN